MLSPTQPVNACYSTNFINLSAGDTNYFEVAYQDTFREVSILANAGPIRPGFTSDQFFQYAAIVDSGQEYSIKLFLDPTLNSWSSSPGWDSVANDTAYYHFVAGPGTPHASTIHLQNTVPTIPTVQLGQTISVFGIINADTLQAASTQSQFTSAFQFTEEIAGSYDPNDKMEFAGAGTPGGNYSGDSLVYRIRFQNTGTDTAFNIRVVDTLSNDFNLSSLRILGASHPFLLEIDSTNILTWNFNHIFLPDSTTNEPASHGWIWFTIEPKTTVPKSKLIKNRSGIFFDFNPVVLTNYSYTKACQSTVFTGQLSLPNPPCPGDSVQLSLSFPFGQEGIYSGWSNGIENSSEIIVSDTGIYQVFLSDSTACFSDTTLEISVTNFPRTSSAFSSTQNNWNVTFSASSQGNPIFWFWKFGDGQTSTLQNPTHTYAANGTYQVCLITANSCGYDTVCNPITINCQFPVAGFTSQSTNFSATFTDQSQNATTWLWDFGDGQTSTLQNPTHTYAANGTYQVCLITSNACGPDTVCNPITINCQFPVAGFTSQSTNFSATFTDQSQNATTWLWDFGDGQSSTSQSPTHTYAANGTYQVCLITSNACGPDTICDSISINCPAPQATFTTTQNQDTVHLNAGSTANSMAWNWDFGDGTTGSGQQVSHVFAQNGNYEICLELIDSCGTDTHCDTVFINLQGRGAEAQIGLQLYPNPAGEQVTIELNRPAQQLKATLWTVQGKALLFRETNIGGAKQLVLPLQGISSGIYFVEIETESGLVWRKLEVLKK